MKISISLILGVGIACLPLPPASAADDGVRAALDEASGRVLITEAGRPVLAYNYREVPVPAGFFDGLSGPALENARKYAKPRGDYLHPLYGPDGEELTADWNQDHPHHRGMYWAWPEVGFNGETGDLHALQRVFARSSGTPVLRRAADWAELEAENRWLWEEQKPIVREVAVIRAWQAGPHGRFIDLTLRFEALVDGVTLARRETTAYGGLNLRLAPIQGMSLSHYADPQTAVPRMAWQAAAGTWKGSRQALTLAIFEHSSNPGYPGDYIEYPALPWFQPTFPPAGQRHALDPAKPLVLRYRIWICGGPPPPESEFRKQWNTYQTSP